MLFITYIALGATNTISLLGWHREIKRAKWYDERCDIIITALLRYMRAHGCPLPMDESAPEFDSLIKTAFDERYQEQTHE